MFLWLLPLFPAEPKLGPVYSHVTHFVPPPFPLLIIAPAIALDLLRPKIQTWSRWRRSLVFGAVFLGVFLAVQWPFADFLQSPASRNWVFGTQYFPFFVPLTDEWVRNVFSQVESGTSQFWSRMGLALTIAMLSARAGLSLGDWMCQLVVPSRQQANEKRLNGSRLRRPIRFGGWSDNFSGVERGKSLNRLPRFF
jgi:hypothetical protein